MPALPWTLFQKVLPHTYANDYPELPKDSRLKKTTERYLLVEMMPTPSPNTPRNAVRCCYISYANSPSYVGKRRLVFFPKKHEITVSSPILSKTQNHLQDFSKAILWFLEPSEKRKKKRILEGNVFKVNVYKVPSSKIIYRQLYQ